jgi:uroporphyrinogen-III decarboxylase
MRKTGSETSTGQEKCQSVYSDPIHGEDVFIVACFDQSPFSLACALAGINELMMMLVTDPPFADGMLEPCIAHASAYAIALAEAGADMLSTGDSPAGMIGLEGGERSCAGSAR